MKALLIIYYLIKLKVNHFGYSLKKLDTWIKIVSLLFVFYIFINSVQSSVFMVDLLKTKLAYCGEYQNALFNINLFIIFVLNVFSIFFMGSSNNYLSNHSALLRMPISIKKIVLSDIIAGVSDIFNVVFFPFYFSVYFLIGNIFILSNILLFSIVLVLFIIFTSNTIYLIAGIFKLLVIPSKHKSIIALFSVILVLAVLKFIINQSSLLTKEYIINIGSFLSVFPTGAIIHFAQGLATNNSFFTFLAVLSYFVLINIILFALNIIVIKKVTYMNKVYFDSRREKPLLSIVRINPFLRKNVLYFLRSPKMIANAFLIFVFYTITLVPMLSSNSIDTSSNETMLALIITFLSIHVVSVLIFGGNVFGHEFSAVINYFFAPISLQQVLVAKMFIPICYTMINFLIGAFVLIYSHISLLNFLLYLVVIFFSSLIFILLGLLFSIYFPKAISYTTMNGLNTSLITVILSLVLTLLFAAVSVIIFGVVSTVLKVVIVIMLFAIGFILLFYYKGILYNISKIFVQQKERLISVCQKKY